MMRSQVLSHALPKIPEYQDEFFEFLTRGISGGRYLQHLTLDISIQCRSRLAKAQ